MSQPVISISSGHQPPAQIADPSHSGVIPILDERDQKFLRVFAVRDSPRTPPLPLTSLTCRNSISRRRCTPLPKSWRSTDKTASDLRFLLVAGVGFEPT